MRLLLLALVLLTLFPAIHADSSTCATCSELINASTTGIFVEVRDADPTNQYIKVTGYYNNVSASPSRQPLKDSIIVIQLTNSTTLNVLQKTYTDGNGSAKFKYNNWNYTCLNFKVMYCPYCNPPSANCTGFKQCLDFAQISTNATTADQITDAADAVQPGTLNPDRYLPQIGTGSWCPPPPPLSATPAICLPLILIFSLLSGALYLTGRNPFAAFNIGGQRVGQHIKYQARGRGFSFSITQAIIAGFSVGQAAATIKKEGMKGFVKKEVDSVKARGFYNVSGTIRGIKGGLKGLSDARAHARAGRGTASGARTSGGPTQVSTAQGVQSASAGGGQVRGADLMGSGRGGWAILDNPLTRILTFVIMSSTIGRAFDAMYSAATFNADAGRGRSVFEAIFADSPTRQASEGVATISAMRGSDGGWLVRFGPGNAETAQVLGERVNSDGSRTYILAAPPGTGPVKDNQIQVTIAQNGTISSVSFTLTLPSPTPQFPNGEARVVISPGARPGDPMNIQVAVPNPDSRPGQPPTILVPYENQFMQTFGTGATAHQEPMTGADMLSKIPTFLSPGSDGRDFQAGYNATMLVVSDAQRQIQEAMAFGGQSIRDRVISDMASRPEMRPVVREARYDVAVDALSTVLGIDPASLRAGGTDHPELTRGLSPGSSEAGEVGRYEVAVTKFSSADSAGTLSFFDDRSGTTRTMTYSQIGTAGGVTYMAERGNPPLSDAARPFATEVLPSVIGHMGGAELAGMTPERLQAAIASDLPRLNAERATHGLPPIAIAGVGTPPTGAVLISAGTMTEMTRVIAPQLSQATAEFRSNLASSGLPSGFIDRVMTSDTSTLGTLSAAGRMMSDDHTADLLSSRPTLISDYRMPESVAQNLREFAFMQRASGLTGIVQNVAPEGEDPIYRPSGGGVQPDGTILYGVAATRTPIIDPAHPETPRFVDHYAETSGGSVEALRNAQFDFLQARMVNESARTPGTFSTSLFPVSDARPTPGVPVEESSEYRLANRGLDSRLLDDRLGFIQHPPEHGMPGETPGAAVARAEAGDEVARRASIGHLIETGDFGTARAETGRAISEFTAAADAAHARGDDATAESLRNTAHAYGRLFSYIDQKPQSCPDMDGILHRDGAMTPTAIGTAYSGTAGVIRDRAASDMIRVKEHIEERLPPRPPRAEPLYREGADTSSSPLTPRVE